MMQRLNKNYTHEYTILNAEHIVHVYESMAHECLEIDLTFAITKEGLLYFTPIIIGNGSYKITLTFLLEDNAQALIKGAYALADSQRCDLITRQYHVGKNSTSNLAINGIAKDMGIIDYRGMIRIEKSALGTQAHQENKTTLFSKSARATSIPSIEVMNHEVSCAHGSAIGPLDTEHILYAQARGINEINAKKMMVRSIFSQMLDRIQQPEHKQQWIDQLTNRIIGE
jgi:Fe-S cluster assembly scaffold protein SufB